MKHTPAKVVAATTLLTSVALAQPARQIPQSQLPPPQYPLQLNNASVDDALFAVAEAGKVNIIADATDWPEAGKTITTEHTDSVVGWLAGLANEFDLTLNADGRAHLNQLGTYSKNYVLWHEPDIEPILQAARQMYTTPTVPNDDNGNPIAQPPDMKNATYNSYLMKWQQEQAGQQVAAWLKAQGVTSASIRSSRDYTASQLPETLRDTLRQLARVSLTNQHTSLNNVKPDVLRKLDDDFWQKARFIYRDVPREKYSFFSIESELEGQPSSIGLIGFYPGLKVGAR